MSSLASTSIYEEEISDIVADIITETQTSLESFALTTIDSVVQNLVGSTVNSGYFDTNITSAFENTNSIICKCVFKFRIANKSIKISLTKQSKDERESHLTGVKAQIYSAGRDGISSVTTLQKCSYKLYLTQ